MSAVILPDEDPLIIEFLHAYEPPCIGNMLSSFDEVIRVRPSTTTDAQNTVLANCCVCREHEIGTVIHPCNHACLCRGCSTLDNCPICRRSVSDYKDIIITSINNVSDVIDLTATADGTADDSNNIANYTTDDRPRKRRRRHEEPPPINMSCVVCETNMSECMFSPCNHVCLCLTCKTPKRCPVCSKKIRRKTKIYIAYVNSLS
jgi:hypothetical protein